MREQAERFSASPVSERSAPVTRNHEPSTDASRRIALPWIVRLRLGMAVGEAALVVGARFLLDVELPLTWLFLAIAAQASTNWLLAPTRAAEKPNIEHIVGALFGLDILYLTLILMLTGGPANPFSLLYLVQITFSALILHRAWTWAIGALSTFCFGLLFWISTDVPALQMQVSEGFPLHLLGMWVAFGTAALLISFFIGKMTDEDRRKERELLQMQQRLARNERLASLVTLSAGAAHEIATPLSTIAVTAREIERQARSDGDALSIGEDAELIRSQVDRCRVILERMGAEGADPLGEAPRRVEFEELFSLVRGRLGGETHRVQTENKGVSRTCVVPVGPTVEALAALVKNALDASPEDQPVTLSVEVGNQGIGFVVRDHGTGMSPEVAERAAEPFFTTKPPGSGMGLGAFLAHLFAQRLGGDLSFDSEPERGTTVVLTLPASRDV